MHDIIMMMASLIVPQEIPQIPASGEHLALINIVHHNLRIGNNELIMIILITIE